MASQGLLFSESSIAETCVWCELSEGIDPAEWASLCRHIGTLSPEELERIKSEIMPKPHHLKSRLRKTCSHTNRMVRIPLVSLGPSGIGGEYQEENI